MPLWSHDGFVIDAVEKELRIDLNEGIFGLMENKPGIFARSVSWL